MGGGSWPGRGRSVWTAGGPVEEGSCCGGVRKGGRARPDRGASSLGRARVRAEGRGADHPRSQ